MEFIESLIKSYRNYYIELENQFIETKRFIEFNKVNNKTFSVEYLKLYQAICSELDVVGKEIACFKNKDFYNEKNKNIQKWGFEVQKIFPNLKNIIIYFNNNIDVQPFINWEYKQYKDKNGAKRLRIVGKKETITWWRDLNIKE